MRRNSAVLALLVAASGLMPLPCIAADIAQGQQLAQRWCRSCHLVAADQRQAAADAPPFSAVARKPDFDVNRLALFLLNPYPRMPNMSLTRSEAIDIASYIGSLAR